MKKFLRKSLFILLTLLSVIFVVACGDKDKLSKKEVIEKFVENSKNIKSMNVVVNMDLERQTTFNREPSHEVVTYEISVIFEPFSMKLNLTLPSLYDIETYIKDDYFYSKTNKNNTWIKENGREVSKEFQRIINGFKSIYDAIKNNIEIVDLSEKDGNYIIEIKDFKNVLKVLKIDKIDLEHISDASLIYIVDKKTFLPISSELILRMELDSGSKENLIMNIEYSNIDNIKEIVIPKEALEAREN